MGSCGFKIGLYDPVNDPVNVSPAVAAGIDAQRGKGRVQDSFSQFR